MSYRQFFIFLFIILCLVSSYIFFLDKNLINLIAISKVIAATGAIALSISLSLGNLAHYFHNLRPYVNGAKYFGITGFVCALVYSLLLLMIKPERYLWGLNDSIFSLDVSLGFISLLILGYLTAISNTLARQRLGEKIWKQHQQMSYIAYYMLIVRAYILEHEQWTDWFETMSNLPPPRLLIAVIGIFILCLKLSVLYTKKIR